MKQVYSNYSAEDFEVWRLLFERQSALLPELASLKFLEGVEAIGFRPDEIPRFDRMNEVLRKTTGWRLEVVPGLIDDFTFFQLLQNKTFPATTWFRTLDQIDYLEQPDMFHDIYGHVPLLTNPDFTGFLQGLSNIALEHIHNQRFIELIARVYWYTIEFGLISGEDHARIYGAGILSSNGESKSCTTKVANHLPYDPSRVLEYPVIKDRFQSQYFVIDSYRQLFESTQELEGCILQK